MRICPATTMRSVGTSTTSPRGVPPSSNCSVSTWSNPGTGLYDSGDIREIHSSAERPPTALRATRHRVQERHQCGDHRVPDDSCRRRIDWHDARFDSHRLVVRACDRDLQCHRGGGPRLEVAFHLPPQPERRLWLWVLAVRLDHHSHPSRRRPPGWMRRGQRARHGHRGRCFVREILIVGQRDRLHTVPDHVRRARSRALDVLAVGAAFGRSGVAHAFCRHAAQQLGQRTGRHVANRATARRITRRTDVVGAGRRDAALHVVAEEQSGPRLRSMT